MTLAELLDRDLAWSMEARGTTNHAPMALVALARLGATPDRLAPWQDRWMARFGIRESAAIFEIVDWRVHRGHRSAFASLRRHFARGIARRGVFPLLTEVFDHLPPAPATAAFHALIRLAYGLDIGHAGEAAAGLAMYVAAHAPLEAEPGGGEAMAPDEALRLLTDRLRDSAWTGDSIAGRVSNVATSTCFAAALPGLARTDASWHVLLAIARRAYIATGNFTVLHLVTGTHAGWVVQSHLPERLHSAFLEAFWIAYAAAYVSASAPVPPSHRLEEAGHGPAWSELRSRAIDSNDEHVIKLVDVLLLEDRQRPHPANRAAAMRVLGIAPAHPADSLALTVR
jgi:hypothetical protein